VTTVSAASGPAAGATTVTISGTNFSGATAVHFGGNLATNVIINTAGTQITAVDPTGSGIDDVTVTTIGGTSATSGADQFTYIPAPVVTGVSPSVGPSTGGTAVTISGTGFSGQIAVSFGGNPATNISVNPAGTQITATAPAGSGTVNVIVTSSAGGVSAAVGADQFTYISVPMVTAISPAAGPATGGTTVTIAGSNFTGASAVFFGATSATSFSVTSASQIVAVAPAELAGVVNVTVTTRNGTSAVASADQFDYQPVLSSAVVNGASVTIAGHSISIAGSQRSMVDNIVFTFNQPVTLGTSAFGIAFTSGVTLTGATDSNFDSALPTLQWSNPLGDGKTWVVTFSGTSVVGNSIADGVYNITVNASQVTASGQTMGSSVSKTFIRLFDSTTGNGQVASRPDYSAIVAADNASYGQASYVAYLDFSAVGQVTSAAVSAAAARLGIKYNGYSATI
jgi:hypothetical protein